MEAEASRIVDPRAERRWRLALTAVFVGLILLAAAIKWIMGWPIGNLPVLGIGGFYILVPVYPHQPLQVGLMFGALLLWIGLHVVAADVNSPVASLGTTSITLSVVGGTLSPYLLRPRRFEAMWRDPEQAAPRASATSEIARWIDRGERNVKEAETISGRPRLAPRTIPPENEDLRPKLLA